MNNEKLNIANIAAYIAQQKGITKKVAAGFLQQLTTTLGEGLLRDGEVKVKGLGTFKIEWHESRMSVNVQTSEKYEIAGHNKVAFTPDKAMREVVNKPFEHLEPVVMDDETASENDMWMDDEELRLKRFSAQAQEILGIIADLQQIQPEEKNQTSPPSTITIESPIDQVQIIQDVPIAKQEIEQTSEPVLPNIVYSTNIHSQIESVEKNSIPAFSDENAMMVRMAKQAPAKNKRWIVLSILFAVVVVISIPIYYYFFIMNHGGDLSPTTTTLASTSSTEKKPVVTPSTQSIQSQSTATKASTQPAIPSNPLTKPRTYKETLATETFTVGSRLTLIALKYYGNKLFWVYIYEANKDKIANPDCISAGTRIKIPKLNPKLIDVHNPQCLIQASALQTAYKKLHATHTK